VADCIFVYLVRIEVPFCCLWALFRKWIYQPFAILFDLLLVSLCGWSCKSLNFAVVFYDNRGSSAFSVALWALSVDILLLSFFHNRMKSCCTVCSFA
jgi:hypothetical protein